MKIGQTAILALVMGASTSFSPAASSQDAEVQQALKALEDALPGRLMHNPYDLQWDSRGLNQKIKFITSKGKHHAVKSSLFLRGRCRINWVVLHSWKYLARSIRELRC